TGGNSELSKDALVVLNNLPQYRIYSMDWDLFESRIPDVDEVRTWKKDTFATFVPAQMSQKRGMKKIEIPLSEYLNISPEESKPFEGLTINVTDWKYNNEVFDKEEEEMRNNKSKLIESRVSFPRCPSY